MNQADQSGAADAGDNLVAAKFTQLFSDESGGFMHIVLKLGHLVQVSAPSRNLGLHFLGAIQKRHVSPVCDVLLDAAPACLPSRRHIE
jgi:hypothetical protein